MRGKGKVVLGLQLGTRITPAYAGKSVAKKSFWQCQRDHPRVCGEKILFFFWFFSALGSPPRMRGKDLLWLLKLSIFRITPAYAGKSARKKSALGGGRDHPRVCGEKPLTLSHTRERVGSPPRMRGKDAMNDAVKAEIRITPAYAGKRRHSNGDENLPWDHPRVCGEKLPRGSRYWPGWGSPPRMRGKD